MEGQETFLYADGQWLYCATNENGYFQKVLLADISRIEHAFLTPLEEGNQEIDQLFAESMGKNIIENETEYRLPIYGMTDQIVVCGPSNILNLETQKGVTPQMYPEEYPRLLQVDDEVAWNKAEAVVLESIGANQVMGADGTIYYELGKE